MASDEKKVCPECKKEKEKFCGGICNTCYQRKYAREHYSKGKGARKAGGIVTPEMRADGRAKKVHERLVEKSCANCDNSDVCRHAGKCAAVICKYYNVIL